jgi:hypothetical protein
MKAQVRIGRPLALALGVGLSPGFAGGQDCCIDQLEVCNAVGSNGDALHAYCGINQRCCAGRNSPDHAWTVACCHITQSCNYYSTIPDQQIHIGCAAIIQDLSGL